MLDLDNLFASVELSSLVEHNVWMGPPRGVHSV